MTTLLFTSLLFLVNAANEPDGEALILADSGAASYSIAVDENATETEQFAAEELARFLSQMSGADFPVIALTDSKQMKGRMILVGPDAARRASDKRFASLDQLGGEGYILSALRRHALHRRRTTARHPLRRVRSPPLPPRLPLARPGLFGYS